MIRKISVSSEVDSYCGKCKMTLNHVVVAMVKDKPKRVQCLTCKSEHNYRLLKAKTSKKTAVKKTTRKKVTAKSKAAAKWQQAIADWDPATAKAYSIYDSYAVDDWVSHVTFGNGIVLEIPEPDRIITLFETGEKMLMQGKARS